MPKGDGGYAFTSFFPSNLPPCLLFLQLCQFIRKVKLDWIMQLFKKQTKKSVHTGKCNNLLTEERITVNIYFESFLMNIVAS